MFSLKSSVVPCICHTLGRHYAAWTKTNSHNEM